MIVLKAKKELELMREAGRIAAGALKLAGETVRAGITTAEIDRAVKDYIIARGAKPSFLGYEGYPASTCISINNEVIHGIPGGRIVKNGDIVSIDIGAFYNGYHGDNAATFAVGEISDEARLLLEVTQESLMRAIGTAVRGRRIGDISYAVQSYVEQFGFSPVKKFVGHGIGMKMHEPPEVPNFGSPGRGARLETGMTIAIEPMINAHGSNVTVKKDGWTVLTESGSLSAHFEHTVAITADGPVILTQV